MKAQNVANLLIEFHIGNLELAVNDIADMFGISSRTAKEYIKTIRNIESDSDHLNRRTVYDRSLKKYVTK